MDFTRNLLFSLSAFGLCSCGAGASYPNVDDQMAVLHEFHESNHRGCAEQFGAGTGDFGDLDGADLWLCDGQSAADAHYAISVVTSDARRVSEGTVLVTLQRNTHPMAYMFMYDYLFRLIGLEDEQEQRAFKETLLRFMMAGPPNTDFFSLYHADNGFDARMANNTPSMGYITIRIDAPE